MLWIHPILQLVATCLALYVFYLGLQRFRVQHLKQKAVFNWKRHVLLGEVVLFIWFMGMVGGIVIASKTWPGVLITGLHAYVGLLIGLLCLFGFATGFLMNRTKKKRTTLPLLHGLGNSLALVLAFFQIYSGWKVLNFFVFE